MAGAATDIADRAVTIDSAASAAITADVVVVDGATGNDTAAITSGAVVADGASGNDAAIGATGDAIVTDGAIDSTTGDPVPLAWSAGTSSGTAATV